MQRNTAGQKCVVFAFDATTNLPKTGDAANITAYVSIDYGAVTVLGDTTATEMDATNAKGLYLFDLAQAETNGNTLVFSGKSATANVVVIGAPTTVFTDPANYTSTVIDSNGRLDLSKWVGTAIPAPAVTGVPKVDVTDVLGSAVTSSGTVDANVVSYAAGEDPLALVMDGANGVETGWTFRQALRLFLSALAAKVSGGGSSTVTFRDVNDTKNRIVATVDNTGNRSAVVLDPS